MTLLIFYKTIAVILLIVPSIWCKVYPSYDGTGNDPTNLGSINTPFKRLIPSSLSYQDGISSINATLPNVRNISNTVTSQASSIKSSRNMTDILTIWSILVTLDVMGTGLNSTDPLPISIPSCDNFFDPLCVGNVELNFLRAQYNSSASGPRTILNGASSFLDGSCIYGSSESAAASLRDTPTGAKFLLDSNGLPPTTTLGGSVTNPAWTSSTDPTTIFLLGHARLNLHPGATALAIIFMREHNRKVDLLSKLNPTWNNETLFQESRQWVVSLLQRVTFLEYLTALFGSPSLSTYTGYNADVDPSISDVFANAAFKYAHSELNGEFVVMNSDGSIESVSLHEATLQPSFVLSHGVLPVLAGMAKTVQQQVDVYIVSDLRNSLFQSSTRGTDMVSIDLQRARDFGLPSYSSAVKNLLGKNITSFNDITTDATVFSNLQAIYTSIDEVDLYIGGLAEDRVTGSNLGPLYQSILIDQFQRMRDGDQFYFQNPGVLDTPTLNEVLMTSLRDIILRNTYYDSTLSASLLPSSLWRLQSITALNTSTTLNSFSYIQFDAAYRLGYRLDDQKTNIHFRMETSGLGWMGVCLECESMADPFADFIIAYLDPDGGTVKVNEYRSKLEFAAPVKFTGTPAITIVSTTVNPSSGGFIVDITRPVDPQDEVHAVLKSSGNQLLYAFNPDRVSSSGLKYHGSGNRGIVQVNFFTGDTVSSIYNTLYYSHGVGMGLVWMFAYPISTLFARYFKHTRHWLLIHSTLQSIGSASISSFISNVLAIHGTNISSYPAHGILGFFLFAIIFLQLLGGTFIANTLKSEKASILMIRGFVKNFHKITGRILLLISIVQVPLGIDLLFPFATAGFLHPAWLIYFIFLIFWTITFIYLEFSFGELPRKFIFFFYPYDKVASTDDSNSQFEKFIIKNPKTLRSATFGGTSLDSIEKMSWEDINDRVLKGAQWVVVDKKVFDLRSWIPHHPGGEAILYQVLGTDISRELLLTHADLSNEDITFKNILPENQRTPWACPSNSNCFKTEEISDAPLPLKKSGNNGGKHGDEIDQELGMSRSKSTLTPARARDSGLLTLINRQDSIRPFTEMDQKQIIRSRLFHVHSRLAKDRLQSLVIGRLSVNKDIIINDIPGDKSKHENTPLSPYNYNEYRRYVITRRVVASGTENSQKPYYIIRLAALHPEIFSKYSNVPVYFLPGEYVEICVRIEGQWITRPYTPLAGSIISRFEILVKTYSGGAMSTFLSSSSSRGSQFKIRGPLGTPLLPLYPELPLNNSHQNLCWDHLFILAGGSGITSALQLIHWYFVLGHAPSQCRVRLIVAVHEIHDLVEKAFLDDVILKTMEDNNSPRLSVSYFIKTSKSNNNNDNIAMPSGFSKSGKKGLIQQDDIAIHGPTGRSQIFMNKSIDQAVLWHTIGNFWHGANGSIVDPKLNPDVIGTLPTNFADLIKTPAQENVTRKVIVSGPLSLKEWSETEMLETFAMPREDIAILD